MLDRRTLIGSATALPFAWVSKAQARTPYTGPMPYVPGPRDFASHADFRIWDAAHREYEERFGYPFAHLVMAQQEKLPEEPHFWIELERLMRRTYKSTAKVIYAPSRQWANTAMFWIRMEHEGEPTTFSQMFLGKADSRHYQTFGSFTVLKT